MAHQPIKVVEPIRFGEGFELDVTARRLSRANRVLKVERIPLEILVLLIENWGEIVPRDEIIARVWGKGAFLDTDNSIRGAIRKIRQVLKDDPEQPHFIQTVTGKGYRFIAPLFGPQEEKRAAGPPDEDEPWAKAPVQVEGKHRTRIPAARRWLVLVAAAAVVVLVFTYASFLHRRTNTTGPRIKSIAVLPMKNLSGDPAQEYLADGMTEEIIGRLAAIHDLRVISRTSVMRFKETQLSVPEIAKQLGVDAVVEGSIIREQSRIRVHAQLILAATDEHLWSESYDRELRDVLALESDVAESIVQKIDVISGQERSRVVTARHVSPEVYESYLRGQFALNKSTRPDLEESIHYFEQALNTDPKFAPAYVALANAYDALGLVFVGAPPRETRAKVIGAAQKALELDPQLADAHVLLADAYRKQWRWTEAEVEYKRALELAPNNAAAHAGFADWLLCKGRAAEAVEWSNRARELDPLVPATNLAWILFQARRYDDAARVLQATLAVTPDDPRALWFLGFVLIAQGKPGDAIPVLEKALSVSHGSAGAKGVLVRAYANAGKRKDALRVLDELKRQRQTEYVPAAALVQAYVGLGDNEQAFAWLEQAYKEQSNLLCWIKSESTFDPLRGDPRFTDLIHRVGLD